MKSCGRWQVLEPHIRLKTRVASALEREADHWLNEVDRLAAIRQIIPARRPRGTMQLGRACSRGVGDSAFHSRTLAMYSASRVGLDSSTAE